MAIESRNKSRKRKHLRIRKNIFGTKEQPRVNVFKSLKNFEAQVINDDENKTILFESTINLKIKNGGNIEAAKKVGESLGDKLIAKKIKKISFDRSGYIYHGKIEAFADALRSKGVKF